MKHLRSFVLACIACVSSTLLGQQHFPPSQRELNGFLLGEDAKPVSEGFDSLIKEQKYNDGWIDRAYSLDTARSAYMVFGFSDSSDDCMSIQITGSEGTEMHPFLGLRLGEPREKVYQILGVPSRVQHLQAHSFEFLQYDDRNYSIELDSLGTLWSIRILGYDGFAANPPDTLPNLETIFQSLRSNDPEIILEALAPDAQLIVGDSMFTFSGSALGIIKDQSSRFSQLLYSGPSNMGSLDISVVRAATLDSASYANNRLNPTFQFPESSLVRDIVFVVHAGKWRIWESHLSHEN